MGTCFHEAYVFVGKRENKQPIAQFINKMLTNATKGKCKVLGNIQKAPKEGFLEKLIDELSFKE